MAKPGKYSNNLNELHQAAASGDLGAEKQLLEYLRDSFTIFAQQRLGNSQDAEEAVQNALMVIQQYYKDITIEKSFAAWCHKILYHKIMDLYKTKGTQRAHKMKLTELANDRSTQNPDPIISRNLLRCLKKVAGRNIRFARILNLHYQGFNKEEICLKLKIKSPYFYVLLSRARNLLADCLKGRDDRDE